MQLMPKSLTLHLLSLTACQVVTWRGWLHPLKGLFIFLFFFPSQMWHSCIFNHKYHPLYNTPAIVDACSNLIVRDFLSLF